MSYDQLLPAFADRPYNTNSQPILHLLGTPLGNPSDISLRAIETLKNCELLLCESRKQCARLFKAWQIPFPRDAFLEYNEHTPPEQGEQICQLILKTNNSVLLSDHGMPVLADPGANLIAMAREHGILINTVPGATAITTALCLAGWGSVGFCFMGFPPRKSQERTTWFKHLLPHPAPVLVLYETPYRLHKLLQELSYHLPRTQPRVEIALAINLCQSDQVFWQGSCAELAQNYTHFAKGPPVVMLRQYQA